MDLNQDSKDIQGLKQQKLWRAMEILTVFVDFRLNQIQNCYVQTKKMKDGVFRLQLKKITSAKRLQTMLDLKMYPVSFIWLEF